MTVKVITKDESIIYKKKIYGFDEEFAVSSKVGNSLIDRGYVEKVSDMPLFSDDTTDEEEFDRLLISDAENGKTYQLFVLNGKVYVDESEG